MRTVSIQANCPLLRNVVLPCPGQVLVRRGAALDRGEVVAEATQVVHYQAYDLCSVLNIKPAEVNACVRRLVGDVFQEGDVLAEKEGFIARILRAPENGRVLSLREGRMILALGYHPVQVKTSLPGIVVELIPQRGAVLSLNAAVLEAAWAWGAPAWGKVVFIENIGKPKLPEGETSWSGLLPVLMESPTDGQMRQLLALDLAGIVLPALPIRQLAEVQKGDCPVMSLCGFGDLRLDPISKKLLDEMQGHEVYMGVDEKRPTLIMPRTSTQATPLFSSRDSMQKGSLVRLLGSPYAGRIGRVLQAPRLQSGFDVYSPTDQIEVALEEGDPICVPWQNLELILL